MGFDCKFADGVGEVFSLLFLGLQTFFVLVEMDHMNILKNDCKAVLVSLCFIRMETAVKGLVYAQC